MFQAGTAPYAGSGALLASGLLRHLGHGARRSGGFPAVSTAIKAALIVVVMFSVGSFNELIVRGFAAPNLQQYVALGLWCLIAFASLFRQRSLRIAPWTDTVLFVSFYGFAVLSTLWSNEAPGSVEKGVALLITTFGAYRLAVSLPLDEIIDSVIIGLFAVCAVSALLALFVPQIAVDQSWMHNGRWTGVFDSKQSLGTAGAFLMFFAAYRVMAHTRWLIFAMTFALAAACVLGSGSRGGGALAIASIAGLYLSRRSPALGRFLAVTPLLMMVLAACLISYMVASGNAFLPWFDEKLDFTQRTVIWEYALRHFPDTPLLGFGLNGFWNVPEIYHLFAREHGWVLDNFHSGYVAVVVETGIVGAILLGLSYVFWTRKVLWLGENGFISRSHFNLLINFTSLSFLINFTETFFLRSTNIISTLLVVLFFITCQTPAARMRPEAEWPVERRAIAR